MADNTTTSMSALLFEMRGPLQENFPSDHVLLAELSGVGDDSGTYKRFTKDLDGAREVFSGSGVRVPLMTAPLQGGGSVSEIGTINQPISGNYTFATIPMTRVVQPFSLSIDIERNSMDNAAAEAVAHLTREARLSLADIENDMLNNSGALLGTVISATGSPGLTLTIGSATAVPNYDRLYPGRVVDVLTRSNGANPGNGLRRLIASISETAFTVTFDTASQASDGNSGNLTFGATEGIYITGSYGTAIQSLGDIAALTGTFEGVSKTAVPGWAGTDGRNGDTTVKAFSAQMADAGAVRGRRSGVHSWDFGIGDPAVINLFKQSLYSQVRFDPQVSSLKSGFSGIMYDGSDKPFPLIKEVAHPKQQIKWVRKDSLQLYGDAKGPDFVDDDGEVGRRFSRALPREVWLLDRVQLGALRCSTTVFFNNLDYAT